MKTKLSFANRKRLLLLFVLLVDSFLFDVHPPAIFASKLPLNCVDRVSQRISNNPTMLGINLIAVILNRGLMK